MERVGLSVCDGLFGSKSPNETKSLPKFGPYPLKKGEDDPSFSWEEMGGLPNDVDGMEGELVLAEPDVTTWRATLGELKLRPMLFPDETLAVARDDGTVMIPEEMSVLDRIDEQVEVMGERD